MITLDPRGGLDDLGEMFQDQHGTHPEPPAGPYPLRRRLVKGVMGFLAVSALTGLGLGAVAAPSAVALSAGADQMLGVWHGLPTDVPVEQALPTHTVLLDSAGKEFARLYSENRVDVPLEEVSDWFVKALVSTEDRRFYEHGGVDVIGTARALVNNVAGGNTQGASTITQQLVQNIMIFNAETEEQQKVADGTSYQAKLLEARYAVQLEQDYSKDQILSMYANAVYFGNRSYGVQAASITYFDKDAADLEPHEAALLVGLLKNPNGYNPFTRPEIAKDRRDTVLMTMRDTGAITQAQYQQYLETGLGLKQGSLPSGCDESDYPYYCALVRDEMLTDPAFGVDAEEREQRLARGGMTITTGLDRQAMEGAQKAVDDSLGRKNRVKAGVAMVEPGSGVIRAVAQNTDWSEVENIYATRPFQSGSTFKSLAVATALEEGIPASTVLNTDGPYKPRGMDHPDGGFTNYGKYNYGDMDAAEALEQSTNVYFIRLTELAGVKDVASMSARLGLHTVPQDLTGAEASIALGTYEVTPLAMAGAYATFASGGTHCEPVATVRVVETNTGQELAAPDAHCTQAITGPVADSMAALLRGPVYGEKGTLARLPDFPEGRDVAAKTGTTNSSAANWTVGFAKQLSAAVWIGDPRGGFRYPLDTVHANGTTYRWVTGAEVAGPIWQNSLAAALKGQEKIRMPRTVNNQATSFDSTRRAPDLVGMPLEAAIAAARASGMDPVVEQETAPGVPGTAAGTVTAQAPEPGAAINPGAQIALTLQEGSNTHVEVLDGTP